MHGQLLIPTVVILKKSEVSYYVKLAPPFLYDQIVIDTLKDQIDSLISKDKFMSEIKTGEQFNLEKIKTSRIDMSRRIQDRGYYYFHSGIY